MSCTKGSQISLVEKPDLRVSQSVPVERTVWCVVRTKPSIFMSHQHWEGAAEMQCSTGIWVILTVASGLWATMSLSSQPPKLSTSKARLQTYGTQQAPASVAPSRLGALRGRRVGVGPCC